METKAYVYVAFPNGFKAWYRDPNRLAGLGDIVWVPLRAQYQLGEVVLVKDMTEADARYFYPSRMKAVDEVHKTFEERPENEKRAAVKEYERLSRLLQSNPECFAFRI